MSMSQSKVEQSCTWPAPAKLNLFLHITGQRSDGMHELQTVFQFIDLLDWINIKVLNSGAIERPVGMAGVAVEDDLVVRAAKKLKQKSGTKLGAEIEVIKNIPAGGGLGGGSSDAATTLVALNQLWDIGMSTEELAELGLSLGADVPVFIRGRAAWAEGVGEILYRVEPERRDYLVVSPNTSISTAKVFQSKELTRNTRKVKIAGSLTSSQVNSLVTTGVNDCEAVVIAHYPEVRDALSWLSQYGEARMTGTGSSIFVALKSRDEAQKLCQKLPKQWRGFALKGMNVSPLMSVVKDNSGIV